MEEKKLIYIIDDNQYGELTNACQYIESGIYDEVVRWVRPDKHTNVAEFKDAACICYHLSLTVNNGGKWETASSLLSDLEDLIGETPFVRYSKGCIAIDYEKEYQVVYEMPKDMFYKRLSLFVKNYKTSGRIDLDILSGEKADMVHPNSIVVFGRQENFGNCDLLKEAGKCKFCEINADVEVDDIIKASIDSATDAVVVDLDEYTLRGIQVAFILRLMLDTLKQAALSRIVGVTKQPIETFFQYYPYSQIIHTEGFSICSVDDLYSALIGTPALTNETFVAGFLDRIYVKENAAYGRHSLANEWGLMALNRFVSDDMRCISDILRKAEKNLFFKYSVVRSMDIHEILGSGSDNEKSKAWQIPKSDKQKGGKYLLIDDKGNDGWKDVLKCCVRDEEAFDVYDKETASYNALPETLREKLKAGFYDVVFLDLRLMSSEENDNVNVMDFSGMKVLQGIKQANPGNQVIIFTASSKSWNLKALIDNGADEYYLKESPLFHFTQTESRENALHLVKAIGYCYRRHYLRKSYKLVEEIKKTIGLVHRLNNNQKNEMITQLDMAFHLLLKITGTNNKDSFAYTFVAFEFVIPMLCEYLRAKGEHTPDKFEDMIKTISGTDKTQLITDGKIAIKARNAYMHGDKKQLKASYTFIFCAEGILKVLNVLDRVSRLL